MPPTLLLLVGRPGVGKSTFSRAFCKTHKFVLLDKDDIAEALCPNDRASAHYLRLHFPIYDAIFQLAETNLMNGLDILIDSPFTQIMKDAKWLAKIDALVAKTGAKLKIVRLYVSETENYQRLKQRGLARDSDKINDFDKSIKDAPMLFDIFKQHLNISAELPMQEQMSQAKEYVLKSV